MAVVRTRTYYDVIYGFSVRVDGMVRSYSRQLTRVAAREAKVRVQTGSQARHRGYPRTGNLARSVGDAHKWANQYGVGRVIYATESYAGFVMKGTAGRGVGYIYRKRARTPTGQFAPGRAGEGRTRGLLPVGKSQGQRPMYLPRVRGQRPNPFIEDALRNVMARWGLLS